ncbi:MAG: asparagine--tRNA ligase [Candidatus Sumerlaeota bacterium]|nr:asparagine--tRNA ligase [Candidatus Sumerlaeota bacterium]
MTGSQRPSCIKDLYRLMQFDIDVLVRGWVRTRRDSKGFSFIEMNDGSCLKNLQVVVDAALPNYIEILRLTVGSAIAVRGRLVKSPAKGQPFELRAEDVTIYGLADPATYPLQKKGHTLEFLRTIAHLRPRSNTFGCVFRIRNTLAWAIHKFFQERDFIYIHTPIITASDCEGAGAMFRVTSLDPAALPHDETGTIDYKKDFFGRPTYLTVSGQLEGELFAMAFSRIYTFGPTFRAENSNTPRHLAEFWMVEPEAAFFDLRDDADLAEDFLKYIIAACLDANMEDLEFLSKWYDKELIPTLRHIVETTFERITYTEAVSLLESSGETFEYPTRWGSDLQTEHERYLTEKRIKKPVIVTDYPRTIKPFYMRQNDDGRTVAAMDILFPRIGEVIGGSQREERLDVLLARIREMGLNEEAYWWYLDTRRYGTVPHAGFGLGFERALQFCTGMSNIRDVIPFPRHPGSAEF